MAPPALDIFPKNGRGSRVSVHNMATRELITDERELEMRGKLIVIVIVVQCYYCSFVIIIIIMIVVVILLLLL